MTIHGYLTEFLQPQHQRLGYTLDEDEDFLYVKQDNHQLAVFNAHASCLDRVDKFIEAREIVENLKDIWLHTGHADTD